MAAFSASVHETGTFKLACEFSYLTRHLFLLSHKVLAISRNRWQNESQSLRSADFVVGKSRFSERVQSATAGVLLYLFISRF